MEPRRFPPPWSVEEQATPGDTPTELNSSVTTAQQMAVGVLIVLLLLYVGAALFKGRR